MNFKNSAPNCTCIAGYYLNKITFECEKCPNRFSTCEYPGKGTCKLSDRETQQCVCQEGFYHISDEQACLPCEYPCKTCFSKSYCIECVDLLNRNLKNCTCLEGYYTNQENECQLCEVKNCKQCNEIGECEECLNENLIPPNCEQEKSGFFIEIRKDSNSQIVNQCSKRCESCEHSKDNCIECTQGLFRSAEPPCLCDNGYHDDLGEQQDCRKCPVGCQSCDSERKCLVCEKNVHRVLNSFNSQCECENGYTEDLKTFECVRCYSYNKRCHIVCPQSTYADEKVFACMEIKYFQKENALLIIISSSIILVVLLGQFLLQKLIFQTKKQNTSKNLQENQEKTAQ